MAFKAYNKRKNNDIYVAIMNAKASRIYYGIYKFDNNSTTVINFPTADNIDNLLEMLKTNFKNDNIILLTDTTNEYKDIVNDYNIDNLVLDTEDIFSDANTLLDYYIYLNDKTNYKKNTFDLDVEYVRPSSAERIKNNGHIN